MTRCRQRQRGRCRAAAHATARVLMRRRARCGACSHCVFREGMRARHAQRVQFDMLYERLPARCARGMLRGIRRRAPSHQRSVRYSARRAQARQAARASVFGRCGAVLRVPARCSASRCLRRHVEVAGLPPRHAGADAGVRQRARVWRLTPRVAAAPAKVERKRRQARHGRAALTCAGMPAVRC